MLGAYSAGHQEQPRPLAPAPDDVLPPDTRRETTKALWLHSWAGMAENDQWAVISGKDQGSLEPEAESVQTGRSNYGCLPMQSIRESSGLCPRQTYLKGLQRPHLLPALPPQGQGTW